MEIAGMLLSPNVIGLFAASDELDRDASCTTVELGYHKYHEQKVS
jgi:hypothetical protein